MVRSFRYKTTYYCLILSSVTTFGIPEADDPDPYGVKALETQGIMIKEAATQERPSAAVFEFKPATTSPVYATFARKSIDSPTGRRSSIRSSWRASITSVASRGTQTEEDASPVRSSVSLSESRVPSPVRETIELPEHEDKSQGSQTVGSDAPAEKESVGEGREKPQENDMAPQKPEMVLYGEAMPEKGSSDKDSVEHVTESSDEHYDDEDEVDSFDRSGASTPDPDEEIEIYEAKPVIAQAMVVSIPKRHPPSLPPRNPQRMSTPSKSRTGSFTSGVDNISLNSDRNSVREDQFHSIPPSPTKSMNV